MASRRVRVTLVAGEYVLSRTLARDAAAIGDLRERLHELASPPDCSTDEEG